MTRPTADREIVITRTFDAPRELAWQAMTDPRHVVLWWGPRGFTTTIQEMDVRPGGVWTHVMHGPDGTDYPNHSVFQEVVYPERIVFAHGGRKPGGPEADFTATWTFEETGDKTQGWGNLAPKAQGDAMAAQRKPMPPEFQRQLIEYYKRLRETKPH